ATPQTAFPLGYMQENRIRTYRADLSSVPANVAGLPAISLPCGRDKDGMPVGLQLIGRRFDEETLLRTAYWYERNGEEKEAEDV
ncbi:MAG: amidase family protein, partial [Christensenellaceae bacterium]